MTTNYEPVTTIVLMCIELIGAVALFVVWYKARITKYKANYFTASKISELHATNPNADINSIITRTEERAGAILPVVVGFAAIEALFGNTVVSYFDLLPVLLSFFFYYHAFTRSPSFFYQESPREDLIATLSKTNADVVQSMLENDTNTRNRLRATYFSKYWAMMLGHINFLPGVVSFVAGTIIDRSLHANKATLVLLLIHTLLISYLLVLALEIVLSWHMPHSKSHTTTIKAKDS